jgi:predicted GIY-YIG superfamily endonuclease
LEHNGAIGKGARYTSARRPVVLVFQAQFTTRSDALKEGARIKLTRQQKQAFISATRAAALEDSQTLAGQTRALHTKKDDV